MSAKGLLVRGGLRVAATCFGRGFVNVPVNALIQYSTMRLCELDEKWLEALFVCYHKVNQCSMVAGINISIILIVITILWNLFLAFSVLLKNPQKPSHRCF